MNGNLTMFVAVTLMTAAVCAELNLLRVFIRDWREHRRLSKPTPSAPARTRTQRSESGNVCRTAVSLACALLLSPALAHAQSANQAASADTAVVPPEEKTRLGEAVSFQFNLDYTTAYFYRGIIQEDSGLILQPAAKLTVNLFQKDDLKLDSFFGTWNSFHGQKTGAQTRGDFSEYWYESDIFAGFTLTTGPVAFTTSYTFLTSPSDAYETVQELGFSVALDDSEWLGKYALKPYATLAIETGADASDGADSDTGIYLELGIAPGFLFDLGQTPVSITFPASVGLSIDNYYQDATGDDDLFGFAQVGAKASLPLPFGERFGAWTLNAGVSLLYLGDNTSDYNGGQDTEVIGTVGFQVNF
jgi:hypothetical protein